VSRGHDPRSDLTLVTGFHPRMCFVADAVEEGRTPIPNAPQNVCKPLISAKNARRRDDRSLDKDAREGARTASALNTIRRARSLLRLACNSRAQGCFARTRDARPPLGENTPSAEIA
jgi:hypothetical protein